MRKLWVGVGVGVVVAAAIGAVTFWHRGGGVAPGALAPGETAAPGGDAELAPPVFDMIRIDPDGSFVISGRGAPDAGIAVALDGAALATASVDARGEWLSRGHGPAAPGLHQITARASAGGRDIEALESAFVLVPEVRGPRPLIVGVSADAPSRLLQAPDWPSGEGLTIEAVDVVNGTIRAVAGRAEPASRLRVSLDGAAIADATANGQGRWSIAPKELRPKPGPHRLVLERLDAVGQPTRTLERPLELGAFEDEGLNSAPVVVAEDLDSWRILRRGGRVTLVYRPAAP